MLIPGKHHRRSIRLRGYDYSQPGGYFITIVTKCRECLFGRIVNDKMVLNKFGELVRNEWFNSERIRKEIELDEFIIMPNHLHGIVFIVGAHGRAPLQFHHHAPLPNTRVPVLRRQPKTIGSFIAGFKSAATKRINVVCNTPRMPVWQRNYYEHVIRDETELNRIREYIIYNPLRWSSDDENPDKVLNNLENESINEQRR